MLRSRMLLCSGSRLQASSCCTVTCRDTRQPASRALVVACCNLSTLQDLLTPA